MGTVHFFFSFCQLNGPKSSFADAPLYAPGFARVGLPVPGVTGDNTSLSGTQTDLWTISLYPRSRHTVRILMFFSGVFASRKVDKKLLQHLSLLFDKICPIMD
jgi:hypothetical protein